MSFTTDLDDTISFYFAIFLKKIFTLNQITYKLDIA